MRLCQKMLCEEAADVYFHGPWCAPHCLERYGKDTISMEARLGDLRHALKEVPAPVAGTDRPARSHDREAAVSDSSSSSAAPGPLYDDALVALLDEKGWDMLDLEWALVAHLDEGMEP